MTTQRERTWGTLGRADETECRHHRLGWLVGHISEKTSLRGDVRGQERDECRVDSSHEIDRED
jgi:hypothetical protein